MLTLVLLASIAQVSKQDFYCIKAQEDWVIDNLESPKRYGQFIPAAIAERVDRWSDPCWRCRKRANEELVAMGPGAMRWMFWTLRSTSIAVQMHSEAVLRGIMKCSKCGGLGYCREFKPRDGLTMVCANCWYPENSHGYEDTTCRHCNGLGAFETDPVEHMQ